ncbi:cell division protein FtsQ/DivIB [Sporomusa acidovorans]|uniref:Cell division protein FtsQ n=1 Tax=Sporomusa acidovorans (strain ATCC 49682 / DSM 3132 / Mol) TaxID=1123286 RepID=A0ABZ3J153_SPOA4|nr:FtsQ-type POTRA domain-containing protein [Sporomusa acidovorans]OZC13610.1 cell division protein DivIB [Sporomusa acidovorans DSM 3132]SDE86868.1 cell division protein FtsQ [Sporomusa acidovorans]
MQTAERLRAARKRRASILALWLAALALIIAIFLFIRSPFFTVGTVLVEGNKYVTVEEVLRIAGVPEQVNIFRLKTTEIQARLMGDLRIAEVQVTRSFPATIAIHIKERQPVAFVASQYGFVEIDRQGIVMAALKNLKEVKVPVVTGIRLGNVYVGDQVDTPGLSNALTYLAGLDEQVLNQLSEVNMNTPDNLIIYTTNSLCIRIGDNQRLMEKAKLTAEILQEISTKKMNVEYIDLNYTSPIIKIRDK